MKYDVEETVTGRIALRVEGDGLNYIATPEEVIIFLDDKQADGIAFQLQSILQDRERKKNLTKQKA